MDPSPSSPRSAEPEAVLPFPPPADPTLRLRRAVLALDRALSEQRTAVSTWRNALADLKATMTRLGNNTEAYRSALGRLAESVSTLQERMSALAGTMGRAEALCADTPSSAQPEEVTNGQPPSLSGR